MIHASAFNTRVILVSFFIFFASPAVMAIASVQPPPPGCSTQSLANITQSFKALSSPRTPLDLLKTLHKIHAGFLLTHPGFFDVEKVREIFGSVVIRSYGYARPGDISMEVMSGSRNRLHLNILLNFSQPMSKSAVPATQQDRRGWLYVVPQRAPNIYAVELIERFLTPGISGKNPDDELSSPSGSDGLAFLSNRPFLTHPKGYHQYEEILESDCHSSSLTVRLNHDGTLRDISLEQRQRGDFFRRD